MVAVLVRFGSKGGVEFDATREFGGAGEAGRADSEFRGMVLRVLSGRGSLTTVGREGWWMSEDKFGITKKGLVTKKLWELRSKSRGEWPDKATGSRRGLLGECGEGEKEEGWCFEFD